MPDNLLGKIHPFKDEREYMLKKALAEVKNDYDYIIIDCAPSLGLLTLNALTAADAVIIPIQCEYFALEGLGKLLNTIKSVQKIHTIQFEILQKALKKWAACENIGQAYLSDGALSKLINTNPSSRELSCYENKNDNDYELTYSGFDVKPVDGRSEGRNIIGSWVTLKNVKLDGDMPINKNIWFRINAFLSQEFIVRKKVII